MASTFGNNCKLTIFGSSHGPIIGMTLEGIPAGLQVDMDNLQEFLQRRAPGQHKWSTSRKEADVPVFHSGIQDGVTTGEVIHAVIYNKNVQSQDYANLENIPRPGHADYGAWMKYGLDFNMAGGGPFSGRMTAPMCIAGGLCKQWLEAKGIRIGAHIQQIADILDESFDEISPELSSVNTVFPVLNNDRGVQMQETIACKQAAMDSVGGSIECAVIGIPAGIGGQLFGGVESHLASILYSIPAVKAVEFGLGSSFALAIGSQSNDAYAIDNGKINTITNHCGGILGGITTGMPVLFRVTMKPTPSIAKPQRSVNLKTMEEVTIEINGRHDPCIVPRAVPVVEAAAAIATYDLLLGGI